LVITVDRDHCLLIYPEPTWIEIERKLDQLPSFNEQARMLQRLYIGHAQEVDMDGQGRVLLPPALRSFASLDRRVALVGQGKKFELWDEETWNGNCDDWLSRADLSQVESSPDIASLEYLVQPSASPDTSFSGPEWNRSRAETQRRRG